MAAAKEATITKLSAELNAKDEEIRAAKERARAESQISSDLRGELKELRDGEMEAELAETHERLAMAEARIAELESKPKPKKKPAKKKPAKVAA